MALDDVKEVIENLQSIINTHQNYLFKKEARTRLVLINPLLQALGWEVSNPAAVQIEYQVKTKRADYVLIPERRDEPIAVIEAKGLGNPLEDDETAQAHIYANQAGIDYMIVTDGDTWKMFKAYGRGVLEDRQIMEFQLSKDLAHECMLQALRIWKSNLASGSPKEAMKPVLAPAKDDIKKAAPADDKPPPVKHSDLRNNSGGNGNRKKGINRSKGVWAPLAKSHRDSNRYAYFVLKSLGVNPAKCDDGRAALYRQDNLSVLIDKTEETRNAINFRELPDADKDGDTKEKQRWVADLNVALAKHENKEIEKWAYPASKKPLPE